MTATFVDPSTFEACIAGMTTEQLDHVSATTRARAAERRKAITVEEAQAAYDAVLEIPGWKWAGDYKECGQVRKACEVLIGWRGYHPDQVAPAMTLVAEEAISYFHSAVAREAVAAGCLDGMAYREGPES